MWETAFFLMILRRQNFDMKLPWHPMIQAITLPQTNIAPENRPLEKEIPIGNHHF